MKRNPFRVFTTLLRPELLKDEELEALALYLLSKRTIFGRLRRTVYRHFDIDKFLLVLED